MLKNESLVKNQNVFFKSVSENLKNKIAKLPSDVSELLKDIIKTNKKEVEFKEKKNTLSNNLSKNLTLEAAQLLKEIVSVYKNEEEEKKRQRALITDSQLKQIIKNNLDSEFKVSDNLNIIKTKTENEKKNFKDIIKVLPPELQKIANQKEALELIRRETDPIKKLTIYEAGVALGLIVGVSGRNETINIMNSKSKTKYDLDNRDSIIYYDDITVNIFFNKNDIITEMQFGLRYEGMTQAGLKIGDSVEKAIAMYGHPKKMSDKCAVWKHFSLFIRNGLITFIRIVV